MGRLNKQILAQVLVTKVNPQLLNREGLSTEYIKASGQHFTPDLAKIGLNNRIVSLIPAFHSLLASIIVSFPQNEEDLALVWWIPLSRLGKLNFCPKYASMSPDCWENVVGYGLGSIENNWIIADGSSLLLSKLQIKPLPFCSQTKYCCREQVGNLLSLETSSMSNIFSGHIKPCWCCLILGSSSCCENTNTFQIPSSGLQPMVNTADKLVCRHLLDNTKWTLHIKHSSSFIKPRPGQINIPPGTRSSWLAENT